MVDVEDNGGDLMATIKEKDLLDLKPSMRQVEDEVMEPNSNYQAYPEALASYQEVVGDKNLFMESLEKLHHAMRTKFMIPTIGGKELDLHLLFVEVSSRGGIEKVIRDRRWKEVTTVFNFPSTATNASFVLRKYYISLLRHYEQIYFFRAKGWTVPATVSVNTTPISNFQPDKGIDSGFPFTDTHSAKRKRKKRNGEVALSAALDQILPANRTVVGVIDGKFEDGYFVTVRIGTTDLKGVLFHATKQNSVQRQPAFPGIYNDGTRIIRRRRRRKKISSMDPTHPKPNRSGYNFFFAEHHAKLKMQHTGKDREISKMIGDLWSNLTETERAVYQEIGLKDKERYQSEMAAYKERQRTGMVLTNVMPIQQRPADNRSSGMQNLNLKEADDADMLSDDGSDTEEEKSDDDLELQTSPEAVVVATESAMAVDPIAFELRRRDLTETRNDSEMASKNGDHSSGDGVMSEGNVETSSERKWDESANN